MLGKNGQIKVRSKVKFATNNANNKTLRHYANGLLVSEEVFASTLTSVNDVTIDSVARTALLGSNGSVAGIGTSATALLSQTVDLTAAVTFTVNGLLAVSSDTMTVSALAIDIYPAM